MGKLKLMVVATAWPWWLIETAVVASAKLARLESGTERSAEVETAVPVWASVAPPVVLRVTPAPLSAIADP